MNGDWATVQSIQKEMNLVGNTIKKEQKNEQKLKHERACQKLSSENNPRKFFQSVKTLTCTEEGTVVLLDRIGVQEVISICLIVIVFIFLGRLFPF